jgi:hypothetical protein
MISRTSHPNYNREQEEPSTMQEVALLALEVVAPPSPPGLYVDPDTGQLMANGMAVID